MSVIQTNFDLAKESFLSILGGLSNDNERKNFLEWIKTGVVDQLPEDFGSSTDVIDGRNRLRIIAQYTKGLIPTQDAILPSESVSPPEDGNPGKVVCSLDAFLFDEEDEEQMIKSGQLSRNFCRDCGSRNTSEIELITHSCSRERLEFIFRSLLPSLQGKMILDVGSRFGAVLYGAYFFSESKKIIGLEMNSDLCQIQRQIIQHFSLQNRISVVEAEMTSRPDLMAEADVIVLNNVWEWFVPTPEWRAGLWQFVKAHAKKGALLVTVPDLDTSFKNLKVPSGIILEHWVRELNPTHPERVSPTELEEETTEVKLYQIL